jgi:DnaJ-domain-containing protein 1
MKKIHDFIIDNAVSIALFMFATVVFSYLLNFHRQYVSDDAGDWGTFGDFVGGTLNPFLSFLALVILLRTFSMQRKELSLQRKELKKTKALLKKQTETQAKQQFESTFFALLNLHNKTLEDFFESKNIKIELEDGTKTNFFDKNLKDMLRDNKNLLKKIKPYFHTGNEMYGQYFRTLYQLLKFIFTEIALDEKESKRDALNFKNDIRLADKNNEKANDIEKRYSNIVRALIPDDVMKFLAVNCYCEDENDIYWEYKLLLERYDFFEHASFNPNNLSNKSVIEQYPILKEAQEFYKKAFGL